MRRGRPRRPPRTRRTSSWVRTRGSLAPQPGCGDCDSQTPGDSSARKEPVFRGLTPAGHEKSAIYASGLGCRSSRRVHESGFRRKRMLRKRARRHQKASGNSPKDPMAKSGHVKRYYPRVQSILLAPVALGLLIGLPFLTKPERVVVGLGLTFVVFLSTLLAWRRVFRVELSNGLICGRNPKTARLTKFELSTITAAHEAEFSLGRIKGWALTNGRGDAVFVSEGVLQDPAVRAPATDS